MDGIALLVALACLAYAVFEDIRRRRVANALWLVMGGAGVLLAGWRIAVAGPVSLSPLLISVVATGLLGYAFYRLGYLGAADVKALLCLALLFPVLPGFSIRAQVFPLLAPAVVMPLPPALLVLGNGLLLALAVPLWLFLYNLRRAGIRGMAGNGTLSFVAYRADVERLPGRRFVRLAHAYEENGGRLSRRFAPGGLALTGDTLQTLRAYYREGRLNGCVWVTPQLPFMLFIALGFVAACLLGV